MWEIALIFLVVLLLFGAKRLPEIGASLGKGIREFKGSLQEIESELKLPAEEKETRPPSPPRQIAPTDEAESGEPRKLTSPDAVFQPGAAGTFIPGEGESS